MLKKPSKRQVEKFLLNSVIVVVGNAITASASSFFIVPNGFTMGGVTGVGIFVRNLLENHGATGALVDWSVNITVYALNIALFILGACLLGKKFAVATGAGTFLYPMFMTVFDLANDAYFTKYGHNIAMGEEFGDPLLAMICGAILFGLGIGIVVRVGASTGGTDIPPLIFKKFFNAPVSVTIWLLDFSIVALNLFAASLDACIYGALIALISSIVVDKVTPIGMRRLQVKIVSDKYREIRDMILKDVARGVTVLYGQSGYLKRECHMLLTVISPRQLVTLKSEVEKIDPQAFMIIGVVSEVHGRGFHTDGVDFLMKQDDDEGEFHPAADPDLPILPEDPGMKPVPPEELAPVDAVSPADTGKSAN